MTEVSTYIIYVFILFFTISSTFYLGNKKLRSESYYDADKLNILYGLILTILAFVIGFRSEVGTDWEGYVSIFQQITTSTNLSFFTEQIEIGYFWLNLIIGNLGLSYQWMFFIIALLSWYFYFKSVPRFILPLFIYFLFVDEFFFWGMSGIRQFLAMAIWIYSIKFIINKNIKRFIIYILIASLFHSSSLILIPFYFLPYQKLYNQFYWIFIYIISLLAVLFLDLSTIYKNLEMLILVLSEDIGSFERYVKYVERDRLTARDTSLGMGFIFKIVINFIVIYLSKNLIEHSPKLKPYVFLFFIGAIAFNLFYEFELLNRIINYFLILRPLVLAYIVYFLWVYRKDRIIGPTVIFLYFIIYLVAIYNNSNMCCPYQFYF